MSNDELHKQAVDLLERLKATRAESRAKSTLKNYNTRRKEAAAAVRPVLTALWEAFERGETVGGCKGRKEWCKKVGTITYEIGLEFGSLWQEWVSDLTVAVQELNGEAE